MGEVTYSDRRLSGSVTERLAARLDEVEAVQTRILTNEAKLIADSLTMDARIDLEQEHQRLLRQRLDAVHRLAIALGGEHVAFVHRTARERWRWLVMGR